MEIDEDSSIGGSDHAAEDDNAGASYGDEFDSMSTLVPLPPEVNIAQFAAHRARELATLTACVEVTAGNKRIFQQLPRHMRRRAQSYNVKRVPRRIQDMHRREVEKVASVSGSTIAKKAKPRSRRHRRRPRQLLLEYNRRQKVYVWLETHIWHAKRFRMCQRWGYKIPLHPCDKSVRACYRGATRAALLQDLSYYCCIEICGDSQKIIGVLQQMTNSKCGPTFESARYKAGAYEGILVLYKRNMYPCGAIGEVRFMWRPQQPAAPSNVVEGGKRQLWIWVHPSCHAEVLSELIHGFKLEKSKEGACPSDVDANVSEPLERLKEKSFLKLAPKLRTFYERTPLYVGDGVNVKDLKDNLVRFRLVGQMSTAILVDVMREASMDGDSLNGLQGTSAPSTHWWQNPDKCPPTTHSVQRTFWQQLRERPFSELLPPNCIVGMVVHDPREGLPPDRTKMFPNIQDVLKTTLDSFCVPPEASHSPLWDQEIRDGVTFSKMTDLNMNDLRSQRLVPGMPLDLGDQGSRIPIVLIHIPGNRTSHVTSDAGMGWDIIMPAGWAMPFWIRLVYRNVRVGGLREAAAVAHLSGGLHFPNDFPDTEASRSFDTEVQRELTAKYFRYPPDKRPNYIKLGIVAPFHSPWKILTEEWSQSTLPKESINGHNAAREFFVLRERNVLRLLQRAFGNERQGVALQSRLREVELEPPKLDDLVTADNAMSIVAIRFKMTSKGCATEFAVICAPTTEDLQELKTNSRFSGPCEPVHLDHLRSQRKTLTDGNRKSKKKKKKVQMCVVDNAQLTVDVEVRRRLDASAEAQKQRLWIPEVSNGVMKACSRNVIGFAKSGCFSYSEGLVTGLAFVSLAALVKMSANKPNYIVLVRSTNTKQYRFATFSVLT